ncbi:MAG: hypothetical protein L6422_02755 [Candidatus Marinimicrobia bacterium]|nr:hypothetical protein [Candidatus Neomarinimicrobiota bacterium]
MYKISILMLFMIALISPVMGIGIEKAEFFDVEQGSTETINIHFFTANEQENNFSLELLIPDKVKNWITVAPEKFTLGANGQQLITITLKVPEDAELGDINGEIKFAGSRVMGGGQIGYTVATTSTFHFRVVKEGAKKEVTFLVLDVKPQIEANKIQKFIATIKNTGNIPATFHTILHIFDTDRKEVYNMTSASINLGVDGIEVVQLFWEPADEGEYTGYFTIAFEDDVKTGVIGAVVKSDTFKFAVGTTTNSVPSLPSNSLSQPVMIWVIIGFLAIACILLVLFRQRRSKP